MAFIGVTPRTGKGFPEEFPRHMPETGCVRDSLVAPRHITDLRHGNQGETDMIMTKIREQWDGRPDAEIRW